MNNLSNQWQVILQLAVAYYAAVQWLSEGVLAVWLDVVEYKYELIYPWLEENKILPNMAASSINRWPTIMAIAGWHTALVLCGLVVGNSLKRLRFIIGWCLGWTFWALSCCLFYFSIMATYDDDDFGVKSMAEAMYWPIDVPNSKHLLSLLGAVSMSTWIGISMSLSALDPNEEGIASAVVARYLPRVVFFYILSFMFFRFGCVPLWNSLVRHSTIGVLPEVPDAALMSTDISVLSRLASMTHTGVLIIGVGTCSALNRLLQKMPCNDREERQRIDLNNFIVLFVLTIGFVLVFAQWVSYAFTLRVAHVVLFAEAFVGPELTASAMESSWSEVHNLVLFSYTAWFCSGVLFEQVWEGSSSNKKRVSSGKTASDAFSAKFLSIVLLLVILPMAYRGGFIGFILTIILFYPKWMPKDKGYNWSDNPNLYKAAETKWVESLKDCPTTKNTYLVIGVGFVGHRLVETLLERGETDIRAFDISPRNPFKGNPHVTYIRGNVCNKDDVMSAAKGVHTVYSTFAIIRFYEELSCQKDLSYNINVKGTINVVEACVENNVKNLITTSTSHVHASPFLNPGHLVEEDFPYVTEKNSTSHYGWTKAEAEQIVLKANGRNGMKSVSCRPCSGVFGKNDRTNLERFQNTRLLPMTFPNTTLDWVFVDNVVLGHLKAEARLNDNTSKVAGEAFNIGNNQRLSYPDLAIGFYKNYAQPGYHPFPSPDNFLWCLGLTLTVLSFLTNGWVDGSSIGIEAASRAGQTNAMLNYGCCIKKAHRILNYEPAYTVEEAVQKCAVEMRNELGTNTKRSIRRW